MVPNVAGRCCHQFLDGHFFLPDKKLLAAVGVMRPKAAFRDVPLHIEGEELFPFRIFDHRFEPSQEVEIGAFTGY